MARRRTTRTGGVEEDDVDWRRLRRQPGGGSMAWRRRTGNAKEDEEVARWRQTLVCGVGRRGIIDPQAQETSLRSRYKKSENALGKDSEESWFMGEARRLGGIFPLVGPESTYNCKCSNAP